MKTKLVFLLLLLLNLEMARSQTEMVELPHHLFSFKVGINRLRTLDRNTSALVYRGNIPTFGFQYTGQKNHNQFLAGLQIGRGNFFSEAYPDRVVKFRSADINGQIDSVNVPARGSNTFGKIALGYLRDINVDREFRYKAGAMLSNDFYYPDGFIQPGLMNVASLSPVFQMDYLPAGKHFFAVTVSIPILNLVSRSTYNNSVSQPRDSRLRGFLNQGSRWRSFGKHRQWKLSAAYRFRINNNWATGLHYDLNLLKNTYPRELTMLQNEFGVSIQYLR